MGDRPQLAGCAGASFAMTVIAQLNPDSFVTNNGSRGTDAAHMHALPARLYIAMTNACAMANALCDDTQNRLDASNMLLAKRYT